MITANIFTFVGDEGILSSCVKALLQAHKSIQIHVIDDCHHPISHDAVIHLACHGKRVSYRRSSFVRQGNLNGPAAVAGILAEMRKSCGDAPGISLKVDSDTLVIKGNWLDLCLQNQVTMLASLRPGNVPSGICYLLANDWLPKLERATSSLELHPTCAEDVTILSTMQAIAQRTNTVIIEAQHAGNPQGTWCGWDYDLSDRYLSKIVDHMDVVTLGNWKFCEGCTAQTAAETAKKIIDLLP